MASAFPIPDSAQTRIGRAAVAAAWIAWGVVFLAVAALVLAGNDHTVVPAYRKAAGDWFGGRAIYTSTGHGFLYFPAAALLFAPFAALPAAAGEIAWRALNVGCFAMGIRRLSSINGTALEGRLFPVLSIASLPAALACARNGQSTLVMTAMMMLACTDLGERRRGRAALWMSLAVAFKPLALVMMLLSPAFDRKMTWRVALGIASVLACPFLTQSPQYVAAQYVQCVEMLRASSRCGMIELWAQPFSVLSLLEYHLSEPVQTLIRAAAAAATFGLCWFGRTRRDAARAAEFLFAFSVLYVLLFNPRTENNTYAMLGPVIGLFAAAPLFLERRQIELAVLSASYVVLCAGDELVRLVSPPGELIWVKPCVGLVVLAVAVRRFVERPRRPAQCADFPQDVRSAA